MSDDINIEEIVAASKVKAREQMKGSGGKEAPNRSKVEFDEVPPDFWDQPIEDEKELIPGMIPCESYTLISGALSAFKTTLLHCLCIYRATGVNLLNIQYPEGVTPPEPGKVVLVTYEDSKRRILRRLSFVVNAARKQVWEETNAKKGALAADTAVQVFMERLRANLRTVSMTGKENGQLVVYGNKGRLVRNRDVVEQIVDKARRLAGEEDTLLIGIDPLRLAFRGSQNDDDGADLVVEVLNYIATALGDRCGVALTSHVTKAQGRSSNQEGGRADAYATAGSGLYSQHARSNFYMRRPTGDQIKKMFGDQITEVEIAKELVVEVTHARLSYGVEGDKRYFVMRGGALVPLSIMRKEGEEAVDLKLLQQIRSVLQARSGEGLQPSQKALEDDQTLGRLAGGRNAVRAAVTRLADTREWLTVTKQGTGKPNLVEVTARGLEAIERAEKRAKKLNGE